MFGSNSQRRLKIRKGVLRYLFSLSTNQIKNTACCFVRTYFHCKFCKLRVVIKVLTSVNIIIARYSK